MKISIAIPTTSMENGENLFIRCLNSLWDQTFQDFEIVVTDNSDDDRIKNICEHYRTGIVYYRNPVKGMASNTNAAIKHSRGELIKILYMDDFLIDNEALETIAKKFHGQWLVNACLHVDEWGVIGTLHIPSYNDRIIEGFNTIGSPSVLTLKNTNLIDGELLYFDENLGWLLDCDYYKRMYELYGDPVIISKPLTGIGIHNGQVTNTISQEIKMKECQYLMNKYPQKSLA